MRGEGDFFYYFFFFKDLGETSVHDLLCLNYIFPPMEGKETETERETETRRELSFAAKHSKSSKVNRVA